VYLNHASIIRVVKDPYSRSRLEHTRRPNLAYSLSHFFPLLVSKIVTFVAFLMGADVPAKDRLTILMAFVKAIVTPSFTLLGFFSNEEN
jgi:hypothetical protein